MRKNNITAFYIRTSSFLMIAWNGLQIISWEFILPPIRFKIQTLMSAHIIRHFAI